MQLVQRGEGRPARGDPFWIFFGIPGGAAEIGSTGPGGVADGFQGQRQRIGQHVEAPGGHLGQHPAEVLARLLQPGHQLFLDHAAAPAGRRLGGGGRQLGGGHRGDPVDQVVRLVDDHDIVLGQDDEVLQRVDGQQGVVGDHEVRPAGLLARLLGEALGAERAALGPDTLPGGDRDLAPGLLGDARRELIAVAGPGRLGPFVQPLHLLADRGGRAGVEERVLRVVLGTQAEALQAQVVAAALEDREDRSPAERRLERPGQPGQVAVDELALQGDRRGRHHDRGALGDRVPHRGDEVGQRLAGSGASLDRQVLAGLDRAVHGLGHRDLSGPLHSPDARDRGREQRCDVRQVPLTGLFTLAAPAGIPGGVSARLTAQIGRLTAGVIRARLAAGIGCGALARMAGGHVKKRYRARPP